MGERFESLRAAGSFVIRKVTLGVAALLLAAVPLLSLTPRASALGGSFDWISQDVNGQTLNDITNGAGGASQGISSDGRYVLFTTAATDAVANDTNGFRDLFRRDRQTGTTELVSLGSSGQQGNQDVQAGHEAISGDGRYVAFTTFATNLGPSTPNTSFVLLRDMQAGTTTTVCNSGWSGHACNSPSISRDGRYISYRMSHPLNFGAQPQIFRYDRTTGTVEHVSRNSTGQAANQSSDVWTRISADGRYVVFDSFANNLVPGDTNNRQDVFRRDMVTGTMERINTTATGAQLNADSQWPTMSDDGRYVVFASVASNLVANDTNSDWDLFFKDTVLGTVQLVGGAFTRSTIAIVSADGTSVVFVTSLPGFSPNDVNNVYQDVYRWDRATNNNTRLSERPDGTELGSHGTNVGNSSIDGISTLIFTNNMIDPNDTSGAQEVYVYNSSPADTVAPTVTGTADRQPNGNGWYDGDVTVTWSAIDPDPSSGTPTTPPPTLANQEGTHTYTSGQSCDPAGNCAMGTATLSIDKSAPTISYSLSQVPNGAGWNASDVTVTFTCQDNVSGVASCSQPQTVGEGANQTVSGTVVDLAGNTASTQVTLNVDKTAPTIAHTISSAPPVSAAGWYKNDVTVAFQCADGLSGLLSCSDPVTLTGEGASQQVNGSAQDVADNTNTDVVAVNIDKTAPVITAQSFDTNPKSVSQSSVTLTAQVDDNLSGVNYVEYYDPVLQTWQPMLLSGSTATALVNTSFMFYPAGSYTFQVRALDRADNQSLTMNAVLYVYNPGGGYVTGTGFVDPGGPSSVPGDNLPAVSGSNPKASFGFSVRYDSPSATVPTGSSTFTYGQACNSPNNDCFSVTTNSFAWLIVPSSNDSAVFQGSATLQLNGQILGSNYPVRVWVEDNSPADHYILRVYAVGANPETAAPLYQASGDPNGSILVHP